MKPNKIAIFLLTLISVYLCTFMWGAVASERLAPTAPNGKLQRAKDKFLDYHKDTTNLDRTIMILQNALEIDPQHLEAMLLLSRAWLTYGYVKAPGDKEQIKAYKNGMDIAEKAVKILPKNPDAHFYYAANMAAMG